VNQRLYLLDGTLLFFRALYGMPDLFLDGAGRAINGVRGYLSYLSKLIAEEQVEYCAAAFDESLTTCWRNQVYPDYKANRPPADDNIRHQLGRCRAVTEILGIPVLADLEYEADDYIATLARRSRREVVVVSRDKDLQQLLSGSVRLLDPASGSTRDPLTFAAEFGFGPALFPDFQALTGDSVDNIPGVRGVGPKSAKRLVESFGALESIYERQDEWHSAGIKPSSKMAERLQAERDQAFLFRRILRLDDQVPLEISLAETKLPRPERKAMARAFDALNFGDGLGGAVTRSLEVFGD